MAWALITGASSGFGRDFARLAALDGYDLILTARRRAPLEALAAELAQAGRSNQVEIVTADLGEPGAADELWAKASAGREIDVLVNNAGLGVHGPFGQSTAQERQLLNVNIMAMSELLQCALTDFRARGVAGKVLNTASLAAFFPAPSMAAYHASKAFVLTLSDAVHFEAKRDGITVTALCPGPTKTSFFEAADMGETWLTSLAPVADSAEVAEAGWRAMKRGRRISIPGAANKLIAFSHRLAPRGILARLNAFFWSPR